MKEWPWWGWSFIIKAAQSWNLTSTYTELVVKIHNTYSTSSYNFNWPEPRTHAIPYCFNLRIHIRTFSTGPYHVLKTRTYTSTGPYHTYKHVRSTRFFLVVYVELMCSRIRTMVWTYNIHAGICNCHLPTIQSMSTNMQHDTYVTATLSICTRYYCDGLVIYISSSISMQSSSTCDTYKYNTLNSSSYIPISALCSRN